MRLSVLCAIAFIASSLPSSAQETATVRSADGFQLPVGPGGNGEGYYIARGYRPNGHLGEDWNGVGGGDTDLGDPVYATANGYVTFARNYHVGWGNVVILRHAYYEGSELKYVDSLYGHLLDFSVQEGEQVRRGQKIGRIGNNFGMYEAHLHFEMRKNLQIGMFRSSFARDFSNYYTPNEFVIAHRACPRGNTMVSMPINTYPPVAPPIIAGPHLESPMVGVPATGRGPKMAPLPPLPQSGPLPQTKYVARATPMPESMVRELTEKSPAAASAPAAKTKTSAEKIAAASPTPAPTEKHGKKSVAAAATPTPEPKLVKSESETKVAASATPAPTPGSKHGKAGSSTEGATTASESTSKTTKKSVAAAATPTPAPASSSKHGKTVAAAATPDPTPKKVPPAIADAPSLPPNTGRLSVTKVHKAATPGPDGGAPSPEAQTITSSPLLPAPTGGDSAPMSKAGAGYKVDRFGDLRSKGY